MMTNRETINEKLRNIRNMDQTSIEELNKTIIQTFQRSSKKPRQQNKQRKSKTHSTKNSMKHGFWMYAV